MKAKLRAKSKTKNLSEMVDHMKSKGIEVNEENLKSRVKVRRTLADLEDKADKLYNKALDSEDDESDIADDNE